MKLELCHVDTCLPDYWSGHHKAHISIAVWRGMTLREIKSALRNEISYGAVMGSDELAHLLSADWVPSRKVKAAHAANRAACAAINRLKPAKKYQRKFFLDLEEAKDDDYRDQICAFFVFVEL